MLRGSSMCVAQMQKIREIQAMIRKAIPESVSLAGDLIAERRAEAAKE